MPLTNKNLTLYTLENKNDAFHFYFSGNKYILTILDHSKDHSAFGIKSVIWYYMVLASCDIFLFLMKRHHNQILWQKAFNWWIVYNFRGLVPDNHGRKQTGMAWSSIWEFFIYRKQGERQRELGRVTERKTGSTIDFWNHKIPYQHFLEQGHTFSNKTTTPNHF